MLKQLVTRTLNNLEAKLLFFIHQNNFSYVKLYLKKENSLLKFYDCANWLIKKPFELELPSRYKKTIKSLEQKNIYTIYDFLKTKPLRVENYSLIVPIRSASQYCTVKGVVLSKSAKKYYSILINDGERLECKWFNLNYYLKHILNSIKVGQTVVCEGKVVEFGLFKEMHHPKIKPLSAFKPHIQVIYPSINKIQSSTISKLIRSCLENQPKKPYDFLPYTIIKRNNLPFLSEVFEALHENGNFDASSIDASVLKRLKYEELFLMQLGLFLQDKKTNKDISLNITVEPDFLEKIEDALPFELTLDQKKSCWDIIKDLSSNKHNSRLLQGDVGSGKTIVALICALLCMKNGYQTCIMSPTTTLAQQSFLIAKEFFSQWGFKTVLLTQTTKKKKQIYETIAKGVVNCVIGTHALLNENLSFQNLGFLVIDEQHRFGVNQRKLVAQKGSNPYTLIMSATPIPRSLNLVLYGKTPVSQIRTMPKTRKRVKTLFLTKKESTKAYMHAKDEILKNHQVYIVFPLIEDSLLKSDLDSVKGRFEEIKSTYFTDFNCAMLHSNIENAQKNTIMEEFRKGKIHCLVSTTVIEVGIDSPNATVMIIENAENFGLAQLHQLRGRVGRSHLESFCYLITNNTISNIAKKRIEILLKTTDGFKIAEEDLRLRGAGEIYSTRQHGLPDLEFADILSDKALLQQAQKDVKELLSLNYPLNEGLLKIVDYVWQKKFDYERIT